MIDKRLVVLGAAAVLVASTSAAVFVACRLPSSAEAAIAEFLFGEGRAEDQLIDPLVLAGDEVVPLVIERLHDRAIPRRRYLFVFIANGRHAEAVPVMKEIATDATESDIIRGDALWTLAALDPEAAAVLARSVSDEGAYLGEIAKSIITSTIELPERRTFVDALVGYHE